MDLHPPPPLFHKFEDMVEFTVVKIPASPGKCSQSCVSKLTFSPRSESKLVGCGL